MNIILATIDGRIVKKQQQAEEQHEQVDCSGLITGIYLLKIVAGEKVINEKIVKK